MLVGMMPTSTRAAIERGEILGLTSLCTFEPIV
jgi:hypothetical protein